MLPDDIKELSVPVLAHRIILEERAALSGLRSEDLVREIVESIPVPDSV